MDTSSIRKNAREALKGKWGKGALITLCYALIELVIGFITGFFKSSQAVYLLLSIGQIIISIPISYGLVISFMKLKRNEDVSAFDFLTLGFSSFKRSWSVSLQMLVKLIVPMVIFIVACVVFYFSISYGTTYFYINNIITSTDSLQDAQNYDELLEKAQQDVMDATDKKADTQATYNKDPSEINLQPFNEAKERLATAKAKVAELESARDVYNDSLAKSFNNNSMAIAMLCFIGGLVVFIAASIFFTIKQYLYVISFNIAIDNPDMTAKEAVEQSKTLMKGNRWKYFVLGLTFIGWILLSCLSFGIGFFFLIPYVAVAKICFYEALAGKTSEQNVQKTESSNA